MQRTITVHIDDLDGRQIRPGTGGTVSFSLDGVDYEIDLSAKHGREMRKVLDPYIAAGRRMPKTSRKKR
ncbi:Lsr2 dimerization domain-containing protein [Nocardioides taihuensis]|uniref:Histone-like nucleoid-structuring protein Lsr2 n=1 Tax=Nocardioides taihuensis TaxID=1835606 RepID=A0ABW0BE99_9ACTN